jgi:hypothetical protein
VCADARTAPWNALILDDDQSQLTCLVVPADVVDVGVEGSNAVCSPIGPDVPPIEAGTPQIEDDAGTLPPLFPDVEDDGGDGDDDDGGGG